MKFENILLKNANDIEKLKECLIAISKDNDKLRKRFKQLHVMFLLYFIGNEIHNSKKEKQIAKLKKDVEKLKEAEAEIDDAFEFLR